MGVRTRFQSEHGDLGLATTVYAETVSTAQPMSHPDAAWLHMDRPTNLMVITGVLWFDQTPDWERVREIIRERFVEPYPRFRQRVVEGGQPLAGASWEDDPRFDLDLHVHRVALPPPGDREELRALVADLTATPLDRTKPLWEFYLVDGFGEGAAMVSRIHHCIADGIALARVLLSLTDDLPDSGFRPPETSEGEPRHGPIGAITDSAKGVFSAAVGAAGTVAHESLEVAKHPTHMLDLASVTREDADALAKVLLKEPEPKTSFKGEMGVVKAVNWSDPISLEDVRTMGHDTGTTVNDVVLTGVAGAFRRYLMTRDSLVDEVNTVIPFNLRPPSEPLPPTLGNRFGLVSIPLPVGIGDRRRRLREIHDRMEKIKHSPEGVVSYGVLDALGRMPEQVERRVIDTTSAASTAVITNVPGPPETVYLAGTPVAGVLVWAPASGDISMTVSIFSYSGEITVGLLVDEGLIPDPGEIVGTFESEIKALLRLKRPAGKASS